MPQRVRHRTGRVSAARRLGPAVYGLRHAGDSRRGVRIGERRFRQSRADREHRHRGLRRPHPRVRTVPPYLRRPRAGLSPSERRRLLVLLGFLSFNAVYVGIVMAPVLPQIAGEFRITTGTAGLVVAAYSAPGIMVAVLTGPYSDRFGRKRFLVTGSLIMGIFTLLSAFATSFAVLVAMRIVAGVGGSVIFPNVTATIGDNFAYRERGSAMGTVIGLNTMAAVIGVPLAGILAEATTWRVSVGLVGVLSIAAAVLLLWKLRPAQTPLSESGIRDMYRSIVPNRSALGAIASSFLGALYWFTWAIHR